ncbi:short-chain dehydrogenase [Alsobacter metallidurans]|uniref:Short-chain dehydrogenase n=1 Tax=Alsobacter metallidurans TaxID=340221 RepID=A0A917MGW3_9HYPH|nr:NnrS family protein [Alsobacter metallidurans]GGH12921.1 short-chain dehydrogenase [Alsobacter metallidurans]
MSPIPRLRPHVGPDLLSYGFRPFFLFGSLFAAAAILAWLPAYFGEITIPTAFAPRDWHAHEMIYGFLPAVITGFLLTAIPNWTGRLPLQGRALAMLVLVWAAGRVAVSTSAWTSPVFAAVVDLLFLALVAAAATREVAAGRNWRNLRVIVIVALLFAGNVVFHVEAIRDGAADYGLRAGLAAAILLITLVGGRVVPSFTRNWLARLNPGRLPAPFGRFDAAAIAASAVALAAWVAAPNAHLTGGAMAIAGALQAVRLARWAGERTWRDRLVFVLHVAYGFVPLGFLLAAAAAFGLLPASAGIHAWTVGAVGLMTLAIMSRASLGHTGRSLVASRPVQAVYALLFTAALGRICAATHPAAAMVLLHAAWLCWVAAFGGFAVAYWKVFTGPRLRA